MLDLLLTEWVTRMKMGSNPVEDHPQLSHNSYPVDGALVCAGSLWPPKWLFAFIHKRAHLLYSVCPLSSTRVRGQVFNKIWMILECKDVL
jgi:hypothetical protein